VDGRRKVVPDNIKMFDFIGQLCYSVFNRVIIDQIVYTASASNFYFKYADDATLLIPSSNLHTLNQELTHHAEWAQSCNLKFNISKTVEIVFPARACLPEPPLNPGVQRVPSVKILGIVVVPKLNFQLNATETLTSCNRSLFALRTLKHHGLDEHMLQITFKATTLAKLLYASPAWSGFLSRSLLDRYEAFLRRAMRFSFCSPSDPCFEALLAFADQNLFKKVLNNEEHVLYPMLPPKKSNWLLPSQDKSWQMFASQR